MQFSNHTVIEHGGGQTSLTCSHKVVIYHTPEAAL